MQSVRRIDLPTGQVPAYRQFCRFVWSFREEDGSTAVGPPPHMYTLFAEDRKECLAVRAVVSALCLSDPEYISSVAVFEDERGIKVSFLSLMSLHAFVVELARCGRTCDDMRKFAEFVLWTLGVRWV